VVEVSKAVRRLGNVPLGDALDRVTEDTDLLPEEKETTVRFGKRDDSAELFTAEAGLARRVLAHPDARPTHLNVRRDDGRASISPDEYAGEKIVGVTVDLPVSALSIKSRPRKNSQHAEVASERVFDTVDWEGGHE
jgi:hypothetical protein